MLESMQLCALDEPRKPKKSKHESPKSLVNGLRIEDFFKVI